MPVSDGPTLALTSISLCLLSRRIGETLHEQVPNVQTVLLTNNSLQELADLDPLGSLPRLTTLSLIGNPVVMRQHYRLYAIFKIPHLRVLDFRRVKQKVPARENVMCNVFVFFRDVWMYPCRG